MKQEDAAKILGLSENINPETVKKAYKRAANKYHPDKGGSVEMMKAVNQAYDVLKYVELDVIESGDLNYPDELNDALNAVLHLKNIVVEVCGAWIWISGETKPHAKILGRKEGGAGFYYASKKKSWYYRPSDWKSSSRGNYTMDDIRASHGSQQVKSKKQSRLSA